MTVCTNDNLRPHLAPSKQVSADRSIIGLTISGLAALWRAGDELYGRIQNRRGVQSMLELDDSLLRDMGVTRDDVRWASQLPLSCRAGEELSRASGRRVRRS